MNYLTKKTANLEGYRLLETKKNGTEVWGTSRCNKCDGLGRIPYYFHNEDGICFKCGGTGSQGYYTKINIYTEERAKELEERAEAKEAKKEVAKKTFTLDEIVHILDTVGFEYPSEATIQEKIMCDTVQNNLIVVIKEKFGWRLEGDKK